MNPISAEIVDATWQEMAQLTPDKIPSLVDQFGQKQPDMMVYLASAGEEVLNDYEREVLFYIGVVVWQMMEKGETPLRQLSIDDIVEAENANFSMLESFSRESEGDMIAATEKSFEAYHQPEVLRYVIEAIMEEDEENEMISEEHKGLMLIFLKTVIDSFDAA